MPIINWQGRKSNVGKIATGSVPHPCWFFSSMALQSYKNVAHDDFQMVKKDI